MEWTILQAIFRARAPIERKVHADPPIQAIESEFRVPSALMGPWNYLLANYNPNAISSAHYLRRNAYYHPAVMDDQFKHMASNGLLEATGMEDSLDPIYAEDYHPTCPQYRVTDKGYRVYDGVEEKLRSRWSLPQVEDAALEQMLTLLARVVDAVQRAPTPPEHWAVDTRMKYGLRLPDGVTPLQRLNQSRFDLWAYRDDVHLVAWRGAHPDLIPRSWEAFTLLWRSEALDAESLAKALEEHGFSAAHYAQSLADLARRGWIEAADGGFRLTDTGRQVRQAAEDLTDQYFYKPWDEVLGGERAHLRALLESLRDRLLALG